MGRSPILGIMNKNYVEALLEKLEHRCPVCGERRYITEQDNHKWIVHCLSSTARFWNFKRDSLGQTLAKQHWEQSGTVF